MNNWKETTLDNAIEIIGGGTPKTSIDEYWNGDIPWLSVVDFNNDSRWVEKTEKTITKDGLKNSSTKLLDAGDLIISARGTVGELAQLKKLMAFNQSCYGIKSKENSNINFLFYLIKWKIKNIKKNVHGAVFDTITKNTFEKIDILLPPTEEQKQIAAVLSSLDDKIELLRAENETLEKIAQGIFKEWFVNFKIDGKKLKLENGVPEGWRVGKLGEAIELFDSKRVPLASDVRAKRKGKYPYYGATSIMDYIDDYLFDGTYLLLAEDGSVIDEKGHPVLQYVQGQFWVSNHSHVLQGRNGFSTEILYVLLKRANVAGIVNGAVQLKINKTNLMNFEIVIPPKNILKTFDLVLRPIFNKSKNNNSQIQTLSRLRDTLLPKLMSGEIKL